MTQKTKYEGIPDSITLEYVQAWVKPRVSERRFKHICGVVDVARTLCQASGCDRYLGELSGWLHDCCKEVKDKELVVMARQFNLALDPILEAHGHLLHGPVGAEVAKKELGITNQEVLDAVAEHTLGNIPMSLLSKISFLSDCLEASRPTDYTDPIWAALDIKGKLNLDKAIVVASDLGLKFLIEDGKPIHPKTVAVRNFYLEQVKSANKAI